MRRRALLAATIFLLGETAGATQINTSNRLEIGADDGSFSLRVRGTLHLDADFYQSDKKHLASGGFVRRARIGISGNIHEWEYNVSYDNARVDEPLANARVSRVIGPGRIWIGQFKVFEGLEEITRSNETLFLERSYLNDIVPGRQFGLAYNGTAGKFGYAATAFNRRNSGDVPADSTGPQAVDVGYGGVARGYFLPVCRKTLVAHLGTSYALEKTEVDGQRLRVRPAGRNDTYADGQDDFKFTIFDRRGEKVDVTRGNVEGLLINGPLTLQAEYMSGRATTATKPDDSFYSWYAMAGYLLTGEYHNYDTKKGRPERPRPQRAIGAVEIAARYQQAVRRAISNASLSATEYGVTYYANDNVRFMINYSLVDNKLTNDNPRLLSMRTQIDF